MLEIQTSFLHPFPVPPQEKGDTIPGHYFGACYMPAPSRQSLFRTPDEHSCTRVQGSPVALLKRCFRGFPSWGCKF